jgi:hypothetical protein
MPRSVAILCLAAAVTFGAPSIPSSAAQNAALPRVVRPAPSEDRPLVDVDLGKFGYHSRPSYGNAHAGSTVSEKIGFSNEGSLIWVWVTRDNKVAHTRQRQNAPNSPERMHLHTEWFDPVTGQEESKGEWPMVAPFEYLLAKDGRVLTWTQEKLRIFSVGSEESQEIDLQSLLPSTSGQMIRVQEVFSTTNFILVGYLSGQDSESVTLDARTLKKIWSVNEDMYIRVLAFSDRLLMGVCGKEGYPCIKPVSGAWGPLYAKGSQPSLKGKIFRADDNANAILMLSTSEMTVSGVNGLVLFRDEIPKGHRFGTFEPLSSTDDGKFAVMEMRLRGFESDFLDMGQMLSDDQIIVYSLSEGRAIYVRKVNGNSPWAFWEWHYNDFALSRDGKFLAVATDEILRVYKLPPTK